MKCVVISSIPCSLAPVGQYGKVQLFSNSRYSHIFSVAHSKQDIFEAQHQRIAMYGLYHRSILSTPILIRIIRDLICHDFFLHHSSRTHLDLELHLRCIVASLRLLSAHGIQDDTGTLSFAYFDELYSRMTVWQSYHRGQVERAAAKEEATKNYNNEFLIVYARDLISSVPSDRTVAANVATRMIAAASALGNAVPSPTSRPANRIVWQKYRSRCEIAQNCSTS